MAKRVKLSAADTVKALTAQMSENDLQDALDFIRFTKAAKFGAVRKTRTRRAVVNPPGAAPIQA